jgi:hypothetical protein
VSAVTIDRDAADILRFGQFRHGYGQHAIFERGGDLVLVDVFERYAPFEAAVVPFAEAPGLVFGF